MQDIDKVIQYMRQNVDKINGGSFIGAGKMLMSHRMGGFLFPWVSRVLSVVLIHVFYMMLKSSIPFNAL